MDLVSPCNHKGYRDWLVQRITAVLLGIFTIFMAVRVFAYYPHSYEQWHALFSHWLMKLITLVVLGSVLWHAWIGLWTVFTDYVRCKYLRFVLEALVCLILIAYLLWTIRILWL